MGKEVVGITGASGFIGRNLVRKLEQNGFNVRIINRMGSLSNQVEGCISIIHLASINNSTDTNVEEVNVGYTQNLVDVLPQDCFLVFTSSFAVYKIPVKGDVISENYPTDPRNLYGKTKLKAEQVIDESGLDAWILRLSNVYGSGMPPFKHSVVSTFEELIRQNRELTIDGDGSQTRDFVHVDDVVSAIIACLKHKPQGTQSINICSGIDTSLNDLVKKIELKLNKSSRVKYNETADMTTAGFWKGDWSRAMKLFGWEPSIFI